MKRIWRNYKEWEDYQNGMYDTTTYYSEKQQEEMAQKAVKLLTDCDMFYHTAKEMIESWPVAALVNLTTASRNFEAWVGQASCSYAEKIPERITKMAWRMLSISQQIEANIVAQRVIDEWRQDNPS